MGYKKNLDGDSATREKPIYLAAAMRGRNPLNPSDRTVGAPTEQRIEVKFDGIVNTITSVQKDTLVVEIRSSCDG